MYMNFFDLVYFIRVLIGRFRLQLRYFVNTVNSRYLDFDYFEKSLTSKRKLGPCFNTEI